MSTSCNLFGYDDFLKLSAPQPAATQTVPGFSGSRYESAAGRQSGLMASLNSTGLSNSIIAISLL